MTAATWKVLEGSALAVLATMPSDSVDCAVTSPPYWGLRDYGTGRWIGGDPACDHKNGNARRDHSNSTIHESRGIQGAADAARTPMRELCRRCGAARIDEQIGLEESPYAYVDRLVAVFREVRRVLRPRGTLWLNLGDCYATGAGAVGECPGGGEQGARWLGDVDRIRDGKRDYRGTRLANGRGDHPAVLRRKTRADRDGTHAGKHTAMAAMGPMTQPNRMPIEGLKPKDLIGIPWRVAFALQADGWWLRRDVVWNKPNPMPESAKDRPTSSHEYVFLFSKAERYFYDYEASRETGATGAWDAMPPIGGTKQTEGSGNGTYSGKTPPSDGKRNLRSVWTIPTEPYLGAHYAVMPREVARRCITAGCPPGGVVLDPFGGSGTTAVVARELGRSSILIELKPENCEMIRGSMERPADPRAPIVASDPQGSLFA